MALLISKLDKTLGSSAKLADSHRSTLAFLRRMRPERSPTGTSQLVLHDFELCSNESSGSGVITGREISAYFVALADVNGFDPTDLLANVAISKGAVLPCRLATKLPAGCSWMDEGSGYIMAKFKCGATVRGHSFLGSEGSASSDPGYVGTAPSRLGLSTGSPPRTRRRPASLPAWMKDHCTSPESPESARLDRTQPLLYRLHRATALATSASPETDSQLVARHICGNKRCLVAAHYRFGTVNENENDKKFHKSQLGRSPHDFPPLQ